MLRRAVWGLPLLVACSFSKELPSEDVTPDAADTTANDPTGPASGRCQGANMALCIDFEEMVKDAIAPLAAISTQNVVQRTRLQEAAAEFYLLSELKIAENDKLDITQAITIEMWTKPVAMPPTSGDKQVGLFDAQLQYQMNFESDREIECRIFETPSSSVNIDSVGTLSLYEWHHVACTYDGAQVRVYIDGRLEGCQALAKPIGTDGTFGAAIGTNMDVGPVYKNHFIGQLDNVHVYARSLSAQEICNLWGNGSCDDSCPTTSHDD